MNTLGTNAVVCWVKPLLAMAEFHTRMLKVLAVSLPIQLSANAPGKALGNGPNCGLLPPTSETSIERPAPGFSLAQNQLLKPFELGNARC